MYPITFCSFSLMIFCYFGAAEPPPRGYGPPAPVEYNSNEVGSQEQYNSAPFDFGSYGSFSSGSPSASHTKSAPSFAPHFAASNGGFPSFKGAGGGKGGVSSSYISIVHGPGGAASPSKNRPVTYHGTVKSHGPSSAYSGNNFGPSNAPYSESAAKFGSSAYSSGEVGGYGSGSSFGKSFGAPAPSYHSSNFEFPSPTNEYKKASYSADVSDEVASYTRGDPSYVTFSGAKPSFNPSTFSHGSSRGGNAYSTSNVNVDVARNSGHGNFHPPAFSGSFKPSGTKNYNRYSSPSTGYQVQGGSPSGNFASNPLVGSETGYNSRALKAGYTAESSNEHSGEDNNNFFGGFNDGAGFKVQSSYSTG